MSLALFGGSFDPVHRGHLRSASELIELLGCEHLALLPAGHSPLKTGHLASSEQRLAMLQLALAEQGNCGGKLTIDRREIDRPGRSYTVETLQAVRAEIGQRQPLYLVVGSDTATQLPRWREWQQLPQLCHLVVVERAQQPLQATPELQTWLERLQCDKLPQLQAKPAGSVFFCRLSQVAISSSLLREKITSGVPLTQWLPSSVAQYIDQHSLYR